jgi:hypothetical protein
MHPSGPEPPTVYWIRRAAVVVVAITVLALLWWVIGAVRGGGSADAAVDSSSASGSPSPAASGSPEASSQPSGDGTATSQPTSSATQDAAPVACEDSAIAVDATTDASTYPVGSTPRLTLTIENTGSVACKRDVGPKANELSITSGGYHVWSSDDCNASDKSKVVVLKAGEKVASSITWDGKITAPNCPTENGPAAKAGTYRVEGRNAKVASQPTPFSLTNKS